tara:strand:- start:941 stop:2500 length:1560 start_codon:yes stop_codon:yes gene_type:complete
MTDKPDRVIDWQHVEEAKDFLGSGLLGIEKESLRVFNSNISSLPHPKSLGSSLCNEFITTDFCEAQLELITPPLANKNSVLLFLDDLHHFVSCNIGDEIFWPFSIPPKFFNTNEIKIAEYGTSNLAIFKHTYRKGLSYRYGREMQAISGLHYNYSLPYQIWESSFAEQHLSDSKDKRSSAYFHIIRNCYRLNWLLLYLFGASPVVNSNFIKEDPKSFSKINKDTYYLPYATSLRMSDIGYRNSKRTNFHISTDSLDAYVRDLRKANETVSDEFLAMNKGKEEDFDLQLNPNIFQIEDEYYAIARAKSNDTNHLRFSNKLTSTGVNFIELRSLDIDPFSSIGIDKYATLFIEAFLIYCFVEPSPFLSEEEIKRLDNNDLSVCKFGRDPNLLLKNQRKKISIKDWGNQVIHDMEAIINILDNEEGVYIKALDIMRSRINNSEETISARILDKISNEKTDFNDLGSLIGSENKQKYLKKQTKNNKNWELLKQSANDSLKKQKNLESSSQKSFKEFVSDYFEG